MGNLLRVKEEPPRKSEWLFLKSSSCLNGRRKGSD